MKWYEDNTADTSVVVAGRVRIVRNLRDHKFPGTETAEEADRLTEELENRLLRLTQTDGRTYETYPIRIMSETERGSLLEKHLINKACAAHPEHTGLLVSKDESVSFTINSADHLRMQVSQSGMDLNQAWAQLDRLDDAVNEMYPYAFDEKLGYMTAYPTNLGTGMKAYLLLHLALLDTYVKFPEIVSEISRYGVKLRPAFGSKKEESGNLYVLSNEKTLGVTEKEIIQVVEKVASQLEAQEKKLRKHSAQANALKAEDLCRKAYGNLRYSKLMTLSSGMSFLSQLRWGQEEHLVSFDRYCNFYELMTAIQPSCLYAEAGKKLEGESEDYLRANLIRRRLPELKEN